MLAIAGVALKFWYAGRFKLLSTLLYVGMGWLVMIALKPLMAALPAGVAWTALHGCAWLGGIGFTMSLFIATLAFPGTNLLDSAKVGILGGSLLAAIVGTVVVRRGTRSARQHQENARY